ncbi:hypothetical protein AY599_22825 [Leptolyngbya valderiana BDU 20041]|nr:hypothetical protein AY599_22825 [Leptolyngbya valderiana BDU 20041]
MAILSSHQPSPKPEPQGNDLLSPEETLEEQAVVQITIGKGKSARTRSLELQPFTLVGATTRVGALTSPLRDRFGQPQISI